MKTKIDDFVTLTRDFLFSLKQFSLRTFFVPFGKFFGRVSTPTTTTRTIKLLLGPLSRARGQKLRRTVTNLDLGNMFLRRTFITKRPKIMKYLFVYLILPSYL